jgi:tetratricopeptide (TPR) repeat protein
MDQYEVHRLVQDAARWELSVRKPDDAAYFSSMALQIVARLLLEQSRGTGVECEKYIAHAIEMGKWVMVCNKGKEGSDLLTSVSEYLLERCSWMDSEPVVKRALALRRQVLGDEHPDTILSMSDLATAYYSQGRYKEAELIYIKALGLRRSVRPEAS